MSVEYIPWEAHEKKHIFRFFPSKNKCNINRVTLDCFYFFFLFGLCVFNGYSVVFCLVSDFCKSILLFFFRLALPDADSMQSEIQLIIIKSTKRKTLSMISFRTYCFYTRRFFLNKCCAIWINKWYASLMKLSNQIRSDQINMTNIIIYSFTCVFLCSLIFSIYILWCVNVSIKLMRSLCFQKIRRVLESS